MKRQHLPAIILIAIAAVILAALIEGCRHGPDGRFLYTLDDPYIHLALAERIRAGWYGLNPGEFAAPSSSILFPFLLAPFAAWDAGAFVPLALNIASTIATLLLMMQVWRLAGATAGRAAGLSLATALALDWFGVAFTGMEQSLQILVSLAAVLGLWRALHERRAPWWLWLALILGPALRYESLAVSGAALLMLPRRQWAAGAATGVAIAAIVGGFGLYLMSHGLPPLPSSVLVKQVAAAGAVDEGAQSILFGLVMQMLIGATERAAAVLTMGAVALGIWLATGGLKAPEPDRRLAMFGALVALAHVVAGRAGGFPRYELYAMTVLVAVGAIVGRNLVKDWLVRRGWGAVSGIAGSLLLVNLHLVYGTLATPLASDNIYEQQFQMHRLVTEFYRAPVAVNDLGLTTYRNPGYVLDLHGLGSEEARRFRTDAARPRDWMDRLARARGTDLAMLYEPWFRVHLPPTWTVLGTLHLGGLKVSAAEPAVTFYATRPQAAGALEPVLAAWAAGLPPGVRFERPAR